MNVVDVQPIIARIDGREVEVGGLLADLCRETTGLVQIVQAQHRLLVDLRANLDGRERPITGLDEWIENARKALQKAEAAERALGRRERAISGREVQLAASVS
jgi:hypothetical protein